MALARVPQMGFSLSPGPTGLGPVLAVLTANGPYLEAYKAQYGIAPPGQLVTLSNGVQGHFTGETDPTSGKPLFAIDFTPSSFRDAAISNYNAQQAGAPPSYAPPVVYQPPPPPAFPGAPGAPPMATSSRAGAKPFFGIPPLALVAGGGLLLFLIARRL